MMHRQKNIKIKNLVAPGDMAPGICAHQQKCKNTSECVILCVTVPFVVFLFGVPNFLLILF
jgi:hypothetical protein